MTTSNLAESPLAALARRVGEVRNSLADAEKRCSGMATLDEAEAERARAALARARGEFSEVRLAIVRRLDIEALHDAAANDLRKTMLARYVYPSAEAAGAIADLLAALTGDVAAAPGGPQLEPSVLGQRLFEAMRLRNHNKTSAARAIRITVKTLDRLLTDEPTKPVKRQAAERYIREATSPKRR